MAADSAYSASWHATGIDAAKVARVTKQVDRLPLDTICRQVRAENTRAWQRWEQRLDFRTVMAARYGLTAAELDGSLADYWTRTDNPVSHRKEVPMSAFVVSRDHIHILVEACARYEILLP